MGVCMPVVHQKQAYIFLHHSLLNETLNYHLVAPILGLALSSAEFWKNLELLYYS
jgi:hypothetical protein